nr:hypothetical 5.1K protein AS1A - Oxytricha nova [Sterkiella nova]
MEYIDKDYSIGSFNFRIRSYLTTSQRERHIKILAVTCWILQQ